MASDDELRRQAEEIGDAALEFDAGLDRHAYIAGACGQNETLKALILEYIQAGDALVIEPLIYEAPSASLENRQIGAWKLLHRLGEGGFGVVYLAERNDGQLRQLGAIKFLKGTVHSRDLELRFLDERQILANLNHSGIVRLIDGDVSREGQPYFVMEFVDDGLPVDVYCSQNGLSVKQRLLLFREVCDAVSYAHRKLVVHRDLKPGNILVTKDGTPRLLDFGVAKILDPAHRGATEAASSTNVLVGTERYFSPEQARREPVDTATDIYSLGVILYELLTGTDPYGLNHRPQESIERKICTVNPEPPSRALTRGTPERLRRQLKGDLDNIVLKALRKDPQRRYASVDQFSEDIHRHLAGLPVTARPDTYGYRSAKFVQRHTAGVAVAAMLVLSLVGGLTATAWEARRAQAAQARAERRFNDVRALANSYLFEFHDEIAKVPGTTAARALVVRRALQYLGSLAKEASGDRQLRLELATAYQKVGDAQGRPGFANIGDRTGALESYRQALAIRKAMIVRGTPDRELRRDLATNYDRIGDTLLTTGKSGDALTSYREGYALREALLSAIPGDQDARRDFATSFQRVAQALLLTGKLAEAQETEKRGLALFEALASNRPLDAVAQRDLFIAYIKEGDLLGAGKDRTGALRYYRHALPIAIAVETIAQDKTKARRETASVHDKIGNLLAASKDPAGALENYRAALRVRMASAAADPNNAEIQRDLSISHEKIGNMLAQPGQFADALEQYRQSLKIDTKLLEGDPDNAQARLDCASSHEKIGELLMRMGDLSRALASEDQARTLREWVASKDDKNVDVRDDLALNYKQLGAINATLAKRTGNAQQLREAGRWYERGLEVLHELQQRGALDPDGVAEMNAIAGELSKSKVALHGRDANRQ